MTSILAVPNKGRLYQPTMELLREADLCHGAAEDRVLSFPSTLGGLEMMLARAADIPRLVESGSADMGVTGLDMVAESGAEVVKLFDLCYGSAKVVLAAPRELASSVEDLRDGLRVATELPRIAQSFFEKRGVRVRVIPVSGAAEIMPRMKVADAVVDIMETGTTLQLQGLAVLEEVLSSSAWLIANKASLVDPGKREVLELAQLMIRSTVTARGKRLVMMNVPDERLMQVVRSLPAMGGPTVAKVESKPPMWEVYSVVENREVFQVVRAAKQAGARDILVLKIEKVIP